MKRKKDKKTEPQDILDVRHFKEIIFEEKLKLPDGTERTRHLKLTPKLETKPAGILDKLTPQVTALIVFIITLAAAITIAYATGNLDKLLDGLIELLKKIPSVFSEGA